MRILLFPALLSLSMLQAQDNATQLPDDKEKELVVKMCSTCHTIERAVKTRYTRKFWGSTVDDMVSRGAEGTEEDAESVISYLARYFGKPVNINTASAKEIEDTLSLKPAVVEAIIKTRTDSGPFKTLEDLAKIPGITARTISENRLNIKL